MGERRASKLGDDGSAAGSAALFASSATTIFASIAFNSSIKANTPPTPVSVGGAHRDGDDGTSHSVLGSAAERKDCATIGLRGAANRSSSPVASPQMRCHGQYS
jgi:hypothetical protein